MSEKFYGEYRVGEGFELIGEHDTIEIVVKEIGGGRYSSNAVSLRCIYEGDYRFRKNKS
jgi:hypothetical protein